MVHVREQNETPPATGGVAASTRSVPVVWLIGAVNVVMLLVAESIGGSQDPEVLVRLGAKVTPLLREGEYWRLITAAFLHFGGLHLLANLWSLVLFGPVLERLVGHGRFAALYLASALAGSAASVLAAPPNAVSAGASGAIFGLLGAVGAIGFRNRRTPLGASWLQQIAVLVALNVVIGLTNPRIGLEAHIGGLLGGVAVMLAWTAEPVRDLPPARRRTVGYVIAGAVAVASVVVAVVAVR